LIPLLEQPEFEVEGYFASFAAVLVISFLALISGIRKRKTAEENENLLLTINKASFQESNAAILVTDPLGNPIHFNELFLETWGLKKETFIGVESQNWKNFAEAHFLDPKVYLDGKPDPQKEADLAIKDVVILKDGRYLQRTTRPLFQGERSLGRIWFYNDITELEQEKVKLEKVKTQLARQNKMLIELAGSEALQEGDLEEVFKQVLDSISEILEADSTSIWMLSENGEWIDRVHCQKPNKEKITGEARISTKAYQEYFTSLESSLTISGKSRVNEGWSTLDAPIRKRGKVVGMVCIGVPVIEMKWEQSMVNFMRSMSDVLAVSLETVERRAAEKELRNKDAIQDAIFELSGLGILVTTAERKIISYNDSYLTMWGMDEEFLLEEQPGTIVGFCQAQLKNGAELRETMHFLINNPDQDQFDLLEFKDGRIVERFTSVLNVDGQILGRVWFFRDISGQVETEQRLRITEARNQAILNSLPDLMLRIDTSGKILDLKVPDNETFLQINSEIIGKPIQHVLPLEFVHRALEQIGEIQQRKEASAFEIEMNLTGKLCDYEARLVPSNPDEILVIVRDVTERKRAEKELVQRNYELDSFVYRASHDLKAPLNSLMGLIDIVRNETTDENVLLYLGLMDKSVVKLDTFIRNLTDFSRINRLEIQYEKVDFGQMFDEITESLHYMEKADRVEKSVHLEPGPPLYADSFHIGIVLGNLISNAIKYQDLSKERPTVDVSVVVTEKEATIIVKDNGVGIPLEYQDRIFELFFRASNQSFGSGLGLYITRNAVEKMAGKISFHSSSDSGTHFIVTIPNQKELMVKHEEKKG
ncbi:MAG TPA: PAS domain S-box protein, partial [Bacteroidetes bacterium]|nr:PAS domain S-box protein [Bacteroidota bacterium]